MIRFAPSSQPAPLEPIKAIRSPAVTVEAAETTPALELTATPATADRPKPVKRRASKKKLAAEATPQLALDA
jgi:hypothetical protein